MNKIAFLVISIGLLFGMKTAIAEPVHDWENPQMIGQNKESAHSTLLPYSNVRAAIKDAKNSSLYLMSLNGTWKFNWSPDPSSRPVDFYKPPADAADLRRHHGTDYRHRTTFKETALKYKSAMFKYKYDIVDLIFDTIYYFIFIPRVKIFL